MFRWFLFFLAVLFCGCLSEENNSGESTSIPVINMSGVVQYDTIVCDVLSCTDTDIDGLCLSFKVNGYGEEGLCNILQPFGGGLKEGCIQSVKMQHLIDSNESYEYQLLPCQNFSKNYDDDILSLWCRSHSEFYSGYGIEFCDEVLVNDTQHWKNYCKAYFSKDAVYCEKIDFKENSLAYDRCYSLMARMLDDPSFCEKTGRSYVTRDVCIEDLITYSENPDYCNLLAPSYSIYLIDVCREDILEKYDDEDDLKSCKDELIQKVYPDYPEEVETELCDFRIALKTRNKSLCDTVESETMKSLCKIITNAKVGGG